jgi:AcrR family transcriptional regulator
MKRARQSHQKLQRREAILAEALGALADTPFQDITMTQVAERTGLVKGTLYLYFSTREELFLEVLRLQLHGWFWDLEAGLEVLPAKQRPEAVARMIARATEARPALRTLLGVLHGSIEHNLPAGTARAFHHEMDSRTQAMGAFLERTLPFLHKGQGTGVLHQIQALIIGWEALVGSRSKDSSDSPEASPRPEFLKELQAGIDALLKGFKEENRRR